MTDDAPQPDIPESFLALYAAAGRTGKLMAPRAQVVADYGLCEDMAQMLAPTAADLQFRLGVTEADVMARCLAGLHTEPRVLSTAQARWVVCRMAELLHWPWQAFAAEVDTPNP